MSKFIQLITSCLLILACSNQVIKLTADHEFNIGESPSLKASGLKTDESYSIRAEMIDTYKRFWMAEAVFLADQAGEIDPARDQAMSGSYSGTDRFGLLWSMSMPNPPGKDWQVPEPEAFNKITFYLYQKNLCLDSVTTIQWEIPKSVHVTEIRDQVKANFLFQNSSTDKKPALLLLGGSGGGLSWANRTGALLATKGNVCMALAYFNIDDLPEHLAQIPIDYVFQAIDQLKQRTDVDTSKIGIIGYSKGAELALLVASKRRDIKKVVAFAPASAVFQGFKPPKYPVISSWSEAGKDLPFVPNNYDKKFFKTFDGMYLWYRTLSQYQLMEKAAIEVEKINGPILMISGIDDKIWPSTRMGEDIKARLHIAEFPHQVKHLAYPEAGHGVAAPPGYPTTRLSNGLGGSAEGNARAREDAWIAVVDFLKN